MKYRIEGISIIHYQKHLQAAAIGYRIITSVYLQIFVVLKYERLKFLVMYFSVVYCVIFTIFTYIII